MKLIEAIVVKYAILFAISFVFYGSFHGLYITTLYQISGVVLLVGLIGDFFILPRSTNRVTVLFDFILIFPTTWIFTIYFVGVRDFSLVIAALVFALLVSFAEWAYHLYLQSRFESPKDIEEKKNE